jgi:hypothetical protein
MSNFICDVCTLIFTDFQELLKHRKNCKHKRKNFTIIQKEAVWRELFGQSPFGTCCICQNELRDNNFVMGHIRSLQNNGSNELNNIVPMCAKCNSSLGKNNLIDYVIKNEIKIPLLKKFEEHDDFLIFRLKKCFKMYQQQIHLMESDKSNKMHSYNVALLIDCLLRYHIKNKKSTMHSSDGELTIFNIDQFRSNDESILELLMYFKDRNIINDFLQDSNKILSAEKVENNIAQSLQLTIMLATLSEAAIINFTEFLLKTFHVDYNIFYFRIVSCNQTNDEYDLIYHQISKYT